MAGPHYGSAAAAVATPASRAERLAWWREARFGMFIHWGPVSLTGLEISWSRANTNPKCPNQGPTPTEVYDHLYERFSPTNLEAAQWVSIAQSAGMKYMVLTAKHCDGFLLWHSQADPYNISATPFQRDVCAELATAARREGMRIGWYFSPMDWRDPDCRSSQNDRFVGHMQAELRELLSNYGRIDLLWFDTDGREAPWHQAPTYALVRGLQPNIVINNRLDLGSQSDYEAMPIGPLADYYTPEQRIGAYDDRRPWETCMTLGTQWSWKTNDNIKSAKETIGILARCVGGDGNLLLNVGPMPDGRIEPRQVEVLKEVGAWLRINGESIYGTRGGPFRPGDYGASTRKGKAIFIHVLHWPDGPVVLPPIPARVTACRLVDRGSATCEQSDRGIELAVSTADRNANDTVIALYLDRDAAGIPAVDVPTVKRR